MESEGPMGAYAGDKLFRIKGVDDTVAIAVKRPYNQYIKWVYYANLK